MNDFECQLNDYLQKKRQQMKVKCYRFKHFQSIPTHSAFQSNREAGLRASAFITKATISFAMSVCPHRTTRFPLEG